MMRGMISAAVGLSLWLAMFCVGGGQERPPQARPVTAATAAVQAPFPPLPPDYQKFLDDVLREWQRRSQIVQRYRCTFKRWEYDPVFGPRDTFKTYSEGSIKYAAPDKGLFKVEKMLDYTPPAQPGAKPTFVPRAGELGEHWICNGMSVFEHDFKTKRLMQRDLPPDMQGKAIADGPLPFLFGADAEKIARRYWVRPLPVPAEAKGEYWLEAYPKTRQDAANYQKVQVFIDPNDFLPKGLVIFDRNFDPIKNPARTTFAFENREVNWNVALDKLNIFTREFYEPKVPFGWKKVIERYDEPAPAAESAPPATVNRNGAAPTNQAQRPAARPTLR